jgi:hypothetical protein
MAFLEACDAVLVQPEGYERSVGTQAELVRATELGIPIFFHLEELIEHFEQKEQDRESSGTDRTSQ